MMQFQIWTTQIDQINRAMYSKKHQVPKSFTDGAYTYTGIVEGIQHPGSFGQGEEVRIFGREVTPENLARLRDTYATPFEAEQYADERLRRTPDIHFTTRDYHTQVRELKYAMVNGQATHVSTPNFGVVYGYVTNLQMRGEIDGVAEFDVTVRPTGPNEALRQRLLQQESPRINLGEYQKFIDRYYPINHKEHSMKVYEAIVVKVDDKGEITEVAKIIPAFAAKDATTAQKTVLIDYAQENGMTGKEAASLRVSVREFSVTT